jgi:hypothetical protein
MIALFWVALADVGVHPLQNVLRVSWGPKNALQFSPFEAQHDLYIRDLTCTSAL